jgi:hypothetical protein
VLSSILFGKIYPVLASILFGKIYPVLFSILFGTTYPVLFLILFEKTYPVLSSILFGCSDVNRVFIDGPLSLSINVRIGPPDFLRKLNGKKLHRQYCNKYSKGGRL